jgi:hypothetical protein
MCAGTTQTGTWMTAKIIVDNGPEFLRRVVDHWAYEDGVEFHRETCRTRTSRASMGNSETNA